MGIPLQLSLRCLVEAMEHGLNPFFDHWFQLNKLFQTLTEKLKADQQVLSAIIFPKLLFTLHMKEQSFISTCI